MTAASLPIRAVRSGRAAATPAAAVPAPPQTIDALPNTVNLNIYQGDDFYLDVHVRNPDGSNTDVTSAAPMAQIRDTPTSADVIATFEIHYDPALDGVLHLWLHSDESTALPLNSVWDLQLNMGDVNTILAGKVTCIREVTR